MAFLLSPVPQQDQQVENADRAVAVEVREAFGQAIALTQRYAPLAVNTLAQVMMEARHEEHLPLGEQL